MLTPIPWSDPWFLPHQAALLLVAALTMANARFGTRNTADKEVVLLLGWIALLVAPLGATYVIANYQGNLQLALWGFVGSVVWAVLTHVITGLLLSRREKRTERPQAPRSEPRELKPASLRTVTVEAEAPTESPISDLFAEDAAPAEPLVFQPEISAAAAPPVVAPIQPAIPPVPSAPVVIRVDPADADPASDPSVAALPAVQPRVSPLLYFERLGTVLERARHSGTYVVAVYDNFHQQDPHAHMVYEGFPSRALATEFARRTAYTSVEELRQQFPDPSELKEMWNQYGHKTIVLGGIYKATDDLDDMIRTPVPDRRDLDTEIILDKAGFSFIHMIQG